MVKVALTLIVINDGYSLDWHMLFVIINTPKDLCAIRSYSMDTCCSNSIIDCPPLSASWLRNFHAITLQRIFLQK